LAIQTVSPAAAIPRGARSTPILIVLSTPPSSASMRVTVPVLPFRTQTAREVAAMPIGDGEASSPAVAIRIGLLTC
jgi:hypothetical protein